MKFILNFEFGNVELLLKQDVTQPQIIRSLHYLVGYLNPMRKYTKYKFALTSFLKYQHVGDEWSS